MRSRNVLSAGPRCASRKLVVQPVPRRLLLPEQRDGLGHLREVRLVPQAEIEANGWDLNIGRYLKTTTGDEIDLDTAIKAYQEARQNRIASEQALFERLAAVGIADLGGTDE